MGAPFFLASGWCKAPSSCEFRTMFRLRFFGAQTARPSE